MAASTDQQLEIGPGSRRQEDGTPGPPAHGAQALIPDWESTASGWERSSFGS